MIKLKWYELQMSAMVEGDKRVALLQSGLQLYLFDYVLW